MTDGFTVFPYRLPLAVPYRWAKGEQTTRAGLLVRCAIDGAEGWGESAPPPHEATDPAALAGAARALVDGLDAADPAFLDRLDARTPHPRLRCGIATAWLAARAAAAGLSLAALLARPDAPAATVPVNALVTDATPDAAAARAAAHVAAGYRTLKIKLGADRAENLARVAAIRAAAPDAVLRLDPNEALDPAWAAAHLDALAAHRIAYAEQPVADHTAEGLARLSAATVVPVIADEAARDLAAVAALIDGRAVAGVILKAQRLGGPDRTLAVARRAHAAGLGVTLTGSLETAVGLTAALHVAACLSPPIADAGLGTAGFFARHPALPPPVVAGRMTVPDGPGLGIAVDTAGLLA